MGQRLAVPGNDAASIARYLHAAHDRFVGDGEVDGVRPLVAESWLRSIEQGIDPEATRAEIRLLEDALDEIRAAHPLTSVMPVIRRLLVESATEAGLVVAVSDAAGQLLYVEGAPRLRSLAEEMNFVPGADWSEASAGTNAPGTALALGRPVQILGAEHLSRQVTPWSCSASPIRDPDNGALLGVLDVTGTEEVATPHALQLVRATAAAAEAELRIARMTARVSGAPAGSVVVPEWNAPRLDVLGRSGAVLVHGGTTTRLTQRHSEMMLVLSGAHDGLTTAQLAVALSDDEQAAVTIRAEVSRLRQLLGPVALESRPYRLGSELRTDVDDVRRAIREGRLRQAVADYRGPVLPSSDAPAVADVRERLHQELRSSLLASDDADAVLTFADTDHGRDDYEIWQHALDVLPDTSPRHAQVARHLARLDAELS